MWPLRTFRSMGPALSSIDDSSPVKPKQLWNFIWLLEKSFEPLFRVFVYLLIILPSGSLFGINLKIICFFLLVGPTFYYLVKYRRTTLLHLCLLIGLPAVLSLWVVVSQFYAVDIGMSFSEYKDIVITLVSSWVAAVFFMQSQDARTKFLKMVIHAEFVACLIKVLLLAYSAFKGIPVSVMVDAINLFFGVKLMGNDFESALGRIQFIADGLIPLCLYMLLRYRRILEIGFLSAIVMFVLLLISLAFTFSRFFWAFAAISFCLGLFGKKDRFHGVLIALVGLIVITVFPLIAGLIQLRFSADVAGGSDSVRTQQIPPLERFFLDAPLLGHGLGSFTPEIIRDTDLPYLYEVQLYALAGQIGIVGIGIMGITILFYFHELWPRGKSWKLQRTNQKGSLASLLLVWLAGGLLNPTLLNSAAAMSYATIKALSSITEDKDKPAFGNQRSSRSAVEPS